MATASMLSLSPTPTPISSNSSSTPKPLQLSPPLKPHAAPTFPQQRRNQVVSVTLRREVILKGLATAVALPLLVLKEAPPSSAKEVEVGSYLPTSPSDPSFVLFKASPRDTPALRAGNVQPYQFILPPTWKQLRIANILSGNYCQPKCAEPWVEVKFEDEKQGKVQVVASPLIRLTNKPNSSIEEIGSPEKLIASLGPFVTGNTYDPDELLEMSVEKRGDQTVQFFSLYCIP
uniref:PsbP C-terminal domain-containing protein n=1 Tax=Fagus sylvatica TaxID=28930 RepID=A0A2N9GQM1_FAGSY